MAFLVFLFPAIWLVTVNKPWNLIGCFVLVFLSHWLGKWCDLEQKIVRFGNKSRCWEPIRLQGSPVISKWMYKIVKVHFTIKLVYRNPTLIMWKKQRKLDRNMVKNPNWQEATSWLFTKRGRVESGKTENKSKLEIRTGFEPGATGRP